MSILIFYISILIFYISILILYISILIFYISILIFYISILIFYISILIFSNLYVEMVSVKFHSLPHCRNKRSLTVATQRLFLSSPFFRSV
jgi:hypothetical protein